MVEYIRSRNLPVDPLMKNIRYLDKLFDQLIDLCHACDPLIYGKSFLSHDVEFLYMDQKIQKNILHFGKNLSTNLNKIK